MRMKLTLVLCLLALLLCACGAQEPAETTTAPTVASTAHVHIYDEEVTPASCGKDGFSTFTCACGDYFTGRFVEASEHSYTETVVPATWDTAGYTEYTCACGDTYRDNHVDPEKYTQLPPSKSGEVMHFFDDAAFIGDSVSLKLQHFQAEYGVFGTAKFFTTVSYSVNHAVNNSLFLIYQGQEMAPEDVLAACGAKKVFILLGMNDIALTGVDTAIYNWGVMLSRIRAKNPDIEVYIQSGTPIFTGGERGALNNVNMDLYNQKLKVFAEENGCHFIDIATTLKDATGGLKAEYCADNYVHVNYAACDAWITELKKYVQE